MGWEKIKRPLLVPGLAVQAEGTASTTPGSVAGDIDVSDAIRGLSATLTGAFAVPIESITSATDAKTLSVTGVSFITYGTSGKPSDIILPDPTAAGLIKQIAVINNTTSVELNINTAASSHTFWGTTYNTATISAASTGGPGGVPGGTVFLSLVAHSTTQWALFPGTTYNWDLAASTGSTATA